MRREADRHGAAGGLAEFLVELGHVAVMADAIGVEAFRHFGEQHLLLRRPARSGHPGLGVDHDLVRIDGAFAQQRNERELRAGGVAARIGDEPRGSDLVAIDLGQPVDGLRLQLRRMVLVAVPARIGGRIGEPKVGGEIDHPRRGRARQKLGDHLLGGGMRQRAEHQIEILRRPVDAVERDQLRQRVGRELRKHLTHLLPGPPVGGEQNDLGARMAQQQAHQFRTGVAGRAKDADPGLGKGSGVGRCGHDSASRRTERSTGRLAAGE